MNTEIWKLQRPLYSNEDMPMVLAYTEDREREQMIPMIDEDMNELFGNEQKIYVEAYVDDDGVLHVTNYYAEEQDW